MYFSLRAIPLLNVTLVTNGRINYFDLFLVEGLVVGAGLWPVGLDLWRGPGWGARRPRQCCCWRWATAWADWASTSTSTCSCAHSAKPSGEPTSTANKKLVFGNAAKLAPKAFRKGLGAADLDYILLRFLSQVKSLLTKEQATRTIIHWKSS